MNASHLMHTYSPQPVAFARGEGAWLWDTEGKKYLGQNSSTANDTSEQTEASHLPSPPAS